MAVISTRLLMFLIDSTHSFVFILVSMSTVTEHDQRSYIKIRALCGDAASVIHQTLVDVCGDSALHYSTVAKWAKEFKEGRATTEDLQRCGRPKSATGPEVLEKLQEALHADRRQTCRELSACLGISSESVRTMLESDLRMKKISAKWIPKELTQEQKDTRVHIAQSLRSRFRKDAGMLERIVAIDETWVKSYEPLSKRKTQEWHTPGEEKPKKVRSSIADWKAMAILAYDQCGVLSCHLLPRNVSVNGERYCQFISTTLRDAIRKKRPKLYSLGPLIIHDNATPHKHHSVQDFLERNGWEVLPHPAYSPDMSPPDFDLIAKIKAPLKGRKFQDFNEMKMAVDKVVRDLNKNWSPCGITELPSRWLRVIQSSGQYFE